MAKRKYNKKKKQSKNSFVIFFTIVIVLAILSYVITYLVIDTDSNSEVVNTVEPEKVDKTEIVQPKVSLDGTWVSYDDGAMLTITGRKYTIELPNVESSVVASGSIVIGNDKITFVNTNQDSECSITPGVYNFKLDVKEELTLKKESDNCKGRSERMEATWFKV